MDRLYVSLSKVLGKCKVLWFSNCVEGNVDDTGKYGKLLLGVIFGAFVSDYCMRQGG